MNKVTITPFPTRPQATITAPCGIKEIAKKVGMPIRLNGAMSRAKQTALALIVRKVAGERQPRESALNYCHRAQSQLEGL